ncbi:MAG: hypothetical protein DRI90_19000, partial [Deltaproteobacteria bacterium]
KDESKKGGGMPGLRMRGMPRGKRPKGAPNASASGHKGGPGGRRGPRTMVWVLEGGEPQPIRLKTGLSDGQVTEVIKGKLEAGTEVITDMKKPEE